MVDKQFDEVGGIPGVVFGPTGRERLAEPGECFRVDGVEDEEVILEQGVDEGASRLL
jgi:hypothetical protein